MFVQHNYEKQHFGTRSRAEHDLYEGSRTKIYANPTTYAKQKQAISSIKNKSNWAGLAN